MGNIIVWLVILGAFGWMAFNYFRIRKAAKFVDNATFEELIRKGQLIDLREPAENSRSSRVTNAALYLKKQGYTDIYVLSYGLDSWNGKVKKDA